MVVHFYQRRQNLIVHRTREIFILQTKYMDPQLSELAVKTNCIPNCDYLVSTASLSV